MTTVKELLQKLIEANNDATLEELQVLVEEHEDVWVSRSTMGRITQALGLTRKKTLHTSECQTDRVQTLRQEYWHTIGQVKLKDLIFLDEAGTHLGMTRRYARSEKGKRAYGQAPKTRGKNVTLIGALSWTQGFIAPMTWQGGTDGLTFRTYVEEVLVPTLWEGACVVMDNFKSHQVEGIRDAIEAVGATLIYLPPYSPDFSPIENCWSKIKESLRSQAARTYDALNDAMANAIDEIHQNDIIGWFTHCCYCGQDN